MSFWHLVQAWIPWRVLGATLGSHMQRPRGADVCALPTFVPIGLVHAMLPGGAGVCVGLLGAPSAMALDLGCSLILWSLLALPAFRRSRIPRVGWRTPSRSRRLSQVCAPRLVWRVLGASPDWLNVILAFGSGLDPLEGFGCHFGLSHATPQGGGCLCIAHLCPHWPRACDAPRGSRCVRWPAWGPICDGA